MGVTVYPGAVFSHAYPEGLGGDPVLVRKEASHTDGTRTFALYGSRSGVEAMTKRATWARTWPVMRSPTMSNTHDSDAQNDWIDDRHNGAGSLLYPWRQPWGIDAQSLSEDTISFDSSAAYKVIVITGQSNAMGFPTSGQYPDALTQIYFDLLSRYHVETSADSGWQHHSYHDTGRWGCDMQLAKRIRSQDPDGPWVIVKTSRSGQSVTAWGSPSGGQWSRLDTMWSNVTTALPNVSVEAIVWAQGEKDATDATLAANYESREDTFFTDVRSLLSAASDVPIYSVQIADSLPAASYPEKDTVQAAKVNNANSRSDVTLIDASAYATRDDVHYTGASQITIGDDIADDLWGAE